MGGVIYISWVNTQHIAWGSMGECWLRSRKNACKAVWNQRSLDVPGKEQRYFSWTNDTCFCCWHAGLLPMTILVTGCGKKTTTCTPQIGGWKKWLWTMVENVHYSGWIKHFWLRTFPIFLGGPDFQANRQGLQNTDTMGSFSKSMHPSYQILFGKLLALDKIFSS